MARNLLLPSSFLFFNISIFLVNETSYFFISTETSYIVGMGLSHLVRDSVSIVLIGQTFSIFSTNVILSFCYIFIHATYPSIIQGDGERELVKRTCLRKGILLSGMK